MPPRKADARQVSKFEMRDREEEDGEDGEERAGRMTR